MADTYTFESLLNTADGMTAVVTNSKQDDNTVSVTGVDWFTYAGKTVSTVYVNGNNWIGFGQSTEQLKVCRRDGAVYYIYRQEGTLDTGKKFLKIRVEGYTYYSSTAAAYAVKYEIFLIEEQTIFVNVIQIPTNSSYIGTSSITDGTNTKSLNITTSTTMPLYVLVDNAGVSQEVTYEMYPGKTYTSISVTTMPDKTSYYEGQTLDLTGLVVTGTTNDGETITIDGYSVSGFDSSTVGTNTLTVSFKKCTTTFDLQILKDIPVEIQIPTLYIDTDHILLNDEQPKISGIDVKYASGKVKYTASGFEVSGFDSSVAGTNTLTITYEGLEKQKDIYVAATATITLSSEAKTTYLIGDEFSDYNTYCTIEYDDGYSQTVYSGLRFSGFDSSKLGTCEITMQYRNIVGTAAITITDTITSNIGSENETDITASLNITTGQLVISGTGATKYIYSPSRGEGGLLNDGGQYSDKVKSLIVKKGITELNGQCFCYMSNMEEATLPDGLLTIGSYCFEYCSSLKELTIPESVNQIGNFAFYNSTETDLILTILSRNVSIENTNSDNSTLRAKKLRGYIASTTEEYAEKYGVEFEALNKIASVSIKTEPDKKEYWTLGEVNSSGLVLNVTDEDGISVDVARGFTLDTPNMETPGEKDVVVKYKEYENTYKITVTAPAFEEILGNSNGMTWTNKISIPWFMFDGETCDNIVCYTDGSIGVNGTKKIDVMRSKYYNSSDTYSASTSNICVLETILDNSVRVAKIRCAGSFTGNYRKGSFKFEIFFFNTGDIYVYISGTASSSTRTWKGTLTSGGNTYNIYGTPYATAGTNVSTQTSCYHQDGTGTTWKTKEEEYSFPDIPQKIEVTTLPDKIDYFIDDTIDTTGLIATLVYGDGRREESKGYSVNSPDMSAVGVKETTVTDAETGITSEPFNVYVNLKKSIGSPNEADILATTDIRNKILKISGSGKTADFDVLHPPFLSVYKYIEKVEIESGITTLGSAIFAAIYEGTTIAGLENVKKIAAYAFYSAKITGGALLANAEEIETTAFTASKFNSINIGNKIKSIGEYAFSSDAISEISIKRFENSISGSPWGAKNATVTWSGTLTSLKVTPPNKTEYIIGEEFDSSGLVVTAVCDTGETEIVTDYSISKFDKNALGKQTITVSYKDLTAMFDVNVYGTTTAIRISHYPTKTYYKSGEILDTTGLVVMIIDSQGTERETTSYNVSNLDTSKFGEQTITVSYQEAKGESLDEVWFDDFQVYVTKDAANPFMKDNADIKITVHWPNGEFKDLTNKDIVKNSMKLKESLCNERYFIWGGCISNSLTFQTGSNQFWDVGDECVPHGNIELYIECEGTKTRLFTGKINSGKRSKGLFVRTITAYDYLYDFRGKDISRWYKNQTTDKQAFLTQKQFRTLLFKYLGIEQEDVKLQYDDTYVPNTWGSSEMDAVDIIQDLCLQNSVFGWMNRNGKFRYLEVKPNARVSGTSKDGVESYEYYDASVHYDVIADESTEIPEGRIWYPKEFLPDPYPGLFAPGDITAQDAYEANIYYIRSSFFVGNDDWIEYVFDADEYGSFTRVKPIMKICYGTTTKIDNQHLYMAQGYKVKVRGNPLTRIGSKIQFMIRKRTPKLPEYPEGKDITWKVDSYIMSRTMEITGRGIMETYSAENGPYNSNKSQLGKHTQEHVAQISRNRSKLPKISYKEFSSGSSGSDFSTQAAEAEIKVADFKCVKKLSYDKYSSMLASGQIRDDTLYCTWEED